ncbi:MAG: hypothetical protein WD733_09135 [Bryobacterales bacterium]
MANPNTVQALAKVEAKTAAEICAAIELSEPARKLLDQQTPPADYLAKLNEAGMGEDAVRFLAHALPKREAVWWACQCIREAGVDSGEAAKAALLAAAVWASDPSEQNRRAAHAAAEKAQGTPEALTALGAFLSGGSMTPPEAPEVKPAEDFTPRTVAGAVMLAAVAAEPEKAPQKYRRFIDLGVQSANQPLPKGKGA